MNRKVSYFIGVFLIFTLFLATQCLAGLFKWEAKEIRKDVIDQKNGYQTIVIWRLKIIDRTKEIKDYVQTSSLPNFDTKAYHETWSEDENGVYYDGLFAAQVLPGDLRWLKNTFHTKFGDFDVYVLVVFNAPSGKLLYMGEYTLEILKRGQAEDQSDSILKKDTKTYYTYQGDFSLNTDSSDVSMLGFHDHFPKLYQQFKDQIATITPYSFYDNFSSSSVLLLPIASTVKSSWAESKNNEHCISGYTLNGFFMNPKDNLAYSQLTKPGFDLPENCRIELECTWKSGDNTLSYGLVFGNSANECYHFNISGAGDAVVWQRADGKSSLIERQKDLASPSDGKTTNLISIEKRGQMIKFLVNGNLVGEYQNSLNISNKNWVIGISVEGVQKVEFNKLTVINLNE